MEKHTENINNKHNFGNFWISGWKRMAFILLMAGWLTSCADDFLEWVPVNAITAENFYRDEAQLQKALTAAYSAVGNRGLYGWWLTVVRIIRGDNCETDQGQMIQHSIFTVNDTDRYLFNRTNGDGMWNSLYVGILRCNLIIVETPSSSIVNQTIKDKIVGQARFLRALYYYHLVTYWRSVPMLLENNYDAVDVPLSGPEELYQAIENDLKMIVENNMLPWVYDGSPGNERGRASMGSALSLLGKVYLHQEKFDLANDAFQQVVASGTYGLVHVNDVFSLASDNGPESVFEVQFSNANAGPNPFFDDGVQAAETTLRNQTIAPNQYGGWENAWPSQSLVDEFEEGDLRFPAFITSPGDMFPTREVPFTGILNNRGNYAIRKGMGSGFSTGTPNGTGEENFPVIRYADVLLMYAESLVRSNSNLNLAIDLIDQVRTRGFGFATIQELRAAGKGVEAYANSRNISIFEAIKHERRVELCFEAHRYTDLQRWGDASTNPTLLDRGWSELGAYYPLPREDVDLSSLID